MAISARDRAYVERRAAELAEAREAYEAQLADRDDVIRLALEAGMGPTELARLFGITRARVHQIRDGR